MLTTPIPKRVQQATAALISTLTTCGCGPSTSRESSYTEIYRQKYVDGVSDPSYPTFVQGFDFQFL